MPDDHTAQPRRGEQSSPAGGRAGLDQRLSTLATLTDPTRRALYEYVRAQAHAVGRDEAASATGLSRSLAAYHLDRLAESGLLQVRYERPPGRTGPGAGRPSKLYSRPPGAVEASIPRRDYLLAARVFADALAEDETGTVLQAVTGVARRLGVSAAGEVVEAGAKPSAEETLAALGYEPYRDGDVVRVRNCLFDSLVEDHKDLACTMNLGLVEGVLDRIEDRTHRACLDPGEGRCCVALVRDQDSATA